MLRARVEEYEADMQKLLASSQHLGHLNPKQKIQYHLRYVFSLSASGLVMTIELSSYKSGISGYAYKFGVD